MFLRARPVKEKLLRMNAVQASSSSALFGSQEYTSVSRVLGELQARRPIHIDAPDEALFLLSVERLDDRRLAEFTSFAGPLAQISLSRNSVH